jgi:hypothetical protein
MCAERAKSKTSAERCGGRLLCHAEGKENKMNLTKYRPIVFLLAFGGLLTLVTTILVTQPGHAAGPWYVAPDGSDGNNCLSPATACATINGAIGKASSGDTIYVAMGTYTGTGDEVVLLNKSATLSGGWDGTFTTQSGTSTIDGQSALRGIFVNAGVIAIVESLNIQNGSATWQIGGAVAR